MLVARTVKPMSMASTPLTARETSKSTERTSMRGSQRLSAERIASSMRPTVPASMVSKTKSCTPQPNSGRIGRSPGAVPRISWIAWSMSCSSRASAMPPRRSTWRGNARPEPMISVTCRPYPRLMIAPLIFTGPDPWISMVAPFSVRDALASTVTLTPLTDIEEPASIVYCCALRLPLPVVSCL